MVSLSYLLFAHLPWQTKEFDQGATRAALSPENALVSPERMKSLHVASETIAVVGNGRLGSLRRSAIPQSQGALMNRPAIVTLGGLPRSRLLRKRFQIWRFIFWATDP